MDSKKFQEIITCSVCFEFFNEYIRCPKILSCGHTFCNSCLEKLLTKSPTCPTCKSLIQSQGAELIPVNYSVKNMISLANQDISPCEAQIDHSESSSTFLGKLESEGYCKEHRNYKELRCMSCESWICGICGMLNHKNCRTLLVKEAYKELKEQVAQKVGKELEIWKKPSTEIMKSLETFEEEKKVLINEIRKRENDLRECKKRIEKFNLLKFENSKLCVNLGRLLTSAEYATDGREFSKAINALEEFTEQGRNFVSQWESLDLYCLSPFPPTIEYLRKLCDEQSVFAVIHENKMLYGKITVNEDQVWISSFQTERPRGILFPLKKLLNEFTAESDLPQKAFLKVTPADETNLEVDLVIEAQGRSPTIRNFILLCSALEGQSYRGRTLERSTNYLKLSSVPGSVIEGILAARKETVVGNGAVVGNASDSGFLFINGKMNYSQSLYQPPDWSHRFWTRKTARY